MYQDSSVLKKYSGILLLFDPEILILFYNHGTILPVLKIQQTYGFTPQNQTQIRHLTVNHSHFRHRLSNYLVMQYWMHNRDFVGMVVDMVGVY